MSDLGRAKVAGALAASAAEEAVEFCQAGKLREVIDSIDEAEAHLRTMRRCLSRQLPAQKGQEPQ